MRTKEQRDRQKAKRKLSKERRKARKAKQFLQRQSARIQRTYRADKRAPLGSKCEHQKCRTGTLRRTQSGRILSTTEGYVQGPVPVRASI